MNHHGGADPIVPDEREAQMQCLKVTRGSAGVTGHCVLERGHSGTCSLAQRASRLTFGQVVALVLKKHAMSMVLGADSEEALRAAAQVGRHPEDDLSHVDRLRLAELDAWLEDFAEKAGLPR